MANKKIGDLSQIITIATGDQMFISDISEAVGDKSKYITVLQLDARYSPDTQTGLTPLGEMFQQANAVETTINTVDIWEQIVNFNAGDLSFVTFASDTFTVQTAGDYLCNASITANATNASQNFEFAFSINDAIQTKSVQHRVFTTASGNIGIVALLALAEDDEVKLEVRNTDNSNNVLVTNANYNIHGI